MTIAQAALERLYGGCNVIHANSLDKFRADLAGVSQPHILLYADAPEEGLVALLRRSDLPFAVVTANPIDVVRDMMVERGIDVCNAIRAASLHFSTLDEIALDQKAIVIRRSAYEYDVEEIVRQLMRVVDRAPDLSQIDELLGDLFAGALLVGVWSVQRIVDASPSSDLAFDDLCLVEDALGDVANLGVRPFARATWGRRLFSSMDTGGRQVPSPLVMAGPVRVVVYGPYVCLSRGRWRGTARFKVEDNFGRVCYRLDVFDARPIFELDFLSPETGFVVCTFEFTCSDERCPIQVRLTQRAGAIEGQLDFDGVELWRID
jgi:hypothetical protein